MDRIELPGGGPWQRFIIKFRQDSGPGRDQGQVQTALDRVAARLDPDGAYGLRLAWERRLGIGADVFQADRPLQQAEARRLMETLSADPDVEYLEVDAVMRAFTPPGVEPGTP